MRIKFFFIFLLFFLTIPVYGDYFNNIKCEQDISDFNDMVLDAVIGLDWKGKEYRRKNDSMQVGNLEFKLISYLFYEDKFYGVAIDIINKDDYNEVINCFQKLYGSPKSKKDVKKLVWFSDNEIITVFRLSTHLAQIQILCEDMFSKLHGVEKMPDIKK